MVKSENIHTCNIVQAERAVCMCLCACMSMYLHICNNTNEKRNHELERKEGEIYGRAWRKAWEGGFYVIL